MGRRGSIANPSDVAALLADIDLNGEDTGAEDPADAGGGSGAAKENVDHQTPARGWSRGKGNAAAADAIKRLKVKLMAESDRRSIVEAEPVPERARDLVSPEARGSKTVRTAHSLQCAQLLKYLTLPVHSEEAMGLAREIESCASGFAVGPVCANARTRQKK